jgi:hypothetical protein
MRTDPKWWQSAKEFALIFLRSLEQMMETMEQQMNELHVHDAYRLTGKDLVRIVAFQFV